MSRLAHIIRPAARRLGVAPSRAAPLVLQRSFADKSPVYSEKADNTELGVGELEGIKFRVEPLRRVGEDERTMRARLLYQSRKRGTLESDLLLSTFANEKLPTMTKDQMREYDLFLDENDWDIYYWATQEGQAPSPPASSSSATKTTAAGDMQAQPPRAGEWSNTVGTFKAAYRPVPARWRGSEILEMLRKHVTSRRADGAVGVHRDVQERKEGGLGFMPPLFEVDRAGEK